MIVPQHGAPIMGKPAIQDFFLWIENLMCGIDLFDDRAYLRIPLMADSDSISIADSVPGDGGHVARVS